jgi:hypothetical protein
MVLDDGKTSLSLGVSVDNDLEVDDEGVLHIVTFIFVEDNEDATEIHLGFEEVVENLIDFYRGDPLETAGYQQLYSIANELARQADRLRDVAGQMEDRNISGNLFDAVVDPKYPPTE